MEVKLNELCKTFLGHVVAVDNVTLEIADGEFSVFVGPSGCGKTTTLRMVAGLEQPDSGSIYIGTTNVINLEPKERNISMVFQNFALFPNMNIFDNIAFPLQVRKWPKERINQRVHEVACLVGVEALLDRKARQVSGGQAQRVSLARAMVRNPDVFLMDEPLSAIDAKVRVQLRTEIKQLHQETKVTTIYVTHDQEEAMTLGQKIVVMDAGKIQQVGTPYQIFHQPHNTFVATFVGSPSMNLFDGQIISKEEGLWVDLKGFCQPLPNKVTENIIANNVKTVKWGIRPEHIKLTDKASPYDMSGQVNIVEPLGSRDLLLVRVEQHFFKVIAEADTAGKYQPGDTCLLRFPIEYVHVFDANSGITLVN